ncbi:MAG TPA: type II toxin-antitoxin system PemK/MazF family toxin [Chitinophagales bacterium]|nr:type II toxin-antitoxin system PemK/MazF family toxin [Chitinophagales bacterium]
MSAIQNHDPHLVISNGSIANTGDLIIAMITSQPRTDGVNIELTSADVDISLPKKSFVRCHRLATIDETIVTKKFATVKVDFLKNVLKGIQSLIEVI